MILPLNRQKIGGKMNKFLVLTLVISSFVGIDSAQANEDKLVCQQFNRNSKRVLSKTIVLVKTGTTLEGEFKIPELQYEAAKTPYNMKIIKNGTSPFNSKDYNGFVYTEDVGFVFKADKSDVVFKLYLDEMESGYLNVSNTKTKYFFCN